MRVQGVFFSFFALLVLFGAGIAEGRLRSALPPSTASREEVLDYYQKCMRVDEPVVDQVLDVFQAALVKANTMNAAGTALPTIGWLSPGDASDLGWSFNSAIGWQALQRCFGTTWYPEVNIDTDGAQAAMRRLVQKGVALIYATSAEYVFEVPEVALQNPNVMFLIPFPVEDFFSIPNIRAVAMNVFEITYMMGYIAEWMTPVNVPQIGELGAIHLFTEYQNHNGFLFGAQDAAAELGRAPREVVYWWLNSYSDADKTLFSAQDLATNYDVHLVAQTPDRYESQRWLRDNGYYGLGATADMGQFIGSTLYASNYVRWDVPGVYLYGLMLTATEQGRSWGTPQQTPLVLPHSVWLGSLGHGTLSVEVPDDLRTKLAEIVATMKSSPFASGFIFCGDRVAQILDNPADLDPVSKCLNFTQFISLNKLHPDIRDLGDYEIPITDVEKQTFAIAIQSTLVAIALLFVLAFFVLVIVYRDTALIALSTFLVTVGQQIALVVAGAGLFLWIPNPTSPLCKSSIFIYTIGMYALLSLFIAKICRYLLLYYRGSKLRKEATPIYWVLPFFFVCFAVGFTLSMCWLLIDNPGMVAVTGEQTSELEKYEQRHICTQSDAGVIILRVMAGYGLFLSVTCMALAYKLGSDAMGLWHSEIHHMVMMSVFITFAIGFGWAISETIEDNQDTLEWMIFICGYVSFLAAPIFFFFPKAWIIVRNFGKDRDDPKCSVSLLPPSEYMKTNRVFGRKRHNRKKRTTSTFSSGGSSNSDNLSPRGLSSSTNATSMAGVHSVSSSVQLGDVSPRVV